MDAENTSSETPRWRKVWDRLSLGHLKWIALAAVLAASAAFGGLDRADHVTPVGWGETYANGPLRVTARSVTLVDYLPSLAPLPDDCRYLVLDVDIENVASVSVPLQESGSEPLNEPTCRPATHGGELTFGMAQPGAVLLGSYRGVTDTFLPSMEPGFTNRFSIVWAVPLADVVADPTVVIRIYDMAQYISAFRINEDWGTTDVVKFGELRTSLEGVR